MGTHSRVEGVDTLTCIAVLSSLRAEIDDTIWESIIQAREEGVSLRRISHVSGISPTHLARKLGERSAA